MICSLLLLENAHAEDCLDQAIVGIYAVNMKTGEVLIDENSQKSFVPSSCMKIVTTAAAYHLLGDKQCFKTRLAYDGNIEKGVLQGNLYVVGGGDPTLGSARFASSLPWQRQIEVWTEEVKKHGIEKIEGKIIADASLWEKAQAVGSWLWEDLGNYYGAGASALSFHENSYHLSFAPGAQVGEKAEVVNIDPPLTGVTLYNEVTTGPEKSGDRACIYGSEFSPIQYVRGTVPKGEKEFSIKGAIPDPTSCCRDLFEEALKNRGIILCDQNLPQGERTDFYVTYSPIMAEIIRETNKQSINLYAEHLLKKIGEVCEGRGTSVEGVHAIESFLQEKKIALSGWHMEDGSGLSRKNLVTPKQLVMVLMVMRESPFFSLFLDSLTEPKRGIKAKSGSMSFIRNYVGYSGDIAFAIMINQCKDAKRAGEKMEEIFSFLLEKSKER